VSTPIQPRRRFQPPRAGWHRELPGRVKRYFDERVLLKWVLITGFSCFVLGYLVITFLFFPGFGRSAIVTVPELAGSTAAQAERALDRAGLEMERGDTLPNPRVRRGRVLMQTPLPGEEVARGSTVRIVLSGGPEMRQVPSLRGLSQADAVGLLQRFGYRVAVARVQDARPEGTLLGVSPAAGQQAAVGTVVTLQVSAGPPFVRVPAVVTLPAAGARARLQAVGLQLGQATYDPASLEPAGTILAQSPAEGDSLRQGSGVRVTVAGVDPNPLPLPGDSLAVDSAAAAEPAPEDEVPAEPAPEPEPEEP